MIPASISAVALLAALTAIGFCLRRSKYLLYWYLCKSMYEVWQKSNETDFLFFQTPIPSK